MEVWSGGSKSKVEVWSGVEWRWRDFSSAWSRPYSTFLGTLILKKWRCGVEWRDFSRHDALYMRVGSKLRMRVCDNSKDE